MKIGFDPDKYILEQSKYILERVNNYDKLYLEFGGKLISDLHAKRVLPGFDENAKIKLLQQLKDKSEIIICVYAGDIERNKIRGDFGITYDMDVLRLIDDLREYGLEVNSVVITRYNGQPATTVFINKLDRPANDPFDILDDVEKELQIRVNPLSWPIGSGDTFKGIYNLHRQNLCLYSPSIQNIPEGIEITDTRSDELDHHIGERAAGKLREDLELIQGVYPSLDRQEYLDAHVAPVFFGSALNNFGIRELLDCFIEIAPAPLARETEERPVRPEEEKFTGFVFKIHANMDPNHRDRIAFVKICSGIFKRNTNYLHVRNGKMLKFSTPTAFMASKKSVIDEAYPGDIIGLHDTGTFKIGDTLTEGEKLHFKGIPSFSPELFKYIENADPMKSKQLAKGIDQLMDEGVAQLFVSQFNNRKIIGTVGALQFEVIEYRLLHEYAAACRWEPINLYKACWIEAQDQAELEDFKKHKAQYMAKDKEGRDVFLADSQYMLHMAQENYKKLIFHFTSEF